MDTTQDEREEELGSLTAIFPELVLDPSDAFSAILELPVAPSSPLLIRFMPTVDPSAVVDSYALATVRSHVERDVKLSHLPPLKLQVSLPAQYPADAPPKVTLSAQSDWLPKYKIHELEKEVAKLWEEYGRCQILFAYIDYLQQAAENGFEFGQSAEGCLVLPDSHEPTLTAFDRLTTQQAFDAGTYDCGVCLEPKKGSACYKMDRCGHVFCKQCLQDFYNNAIKEGDVSGVRCLDPSCGKEKNNKRRSERTVHPRELLAMGIDESMVRRYVEMKRKKELEADKTTVYCPRTWCQGPAKSAKYPPIPADLEAYISNDLSSDDENDREETLQGPAAAHVAPKVNGNNAPPDPTERLSVCEKCSFAFCKVCYMGWHGPFARCFPRNPAELSKEEKASYDYIRMHTSPCPYCMAPVQKTMGCNHMSCFNCRTHFCYLCGSWLDPQNPYQHFNKGGSPCYQRLWELEEGDEGQAPEDGRGFVGGARGWEQLAIEAARQADEEEAEAAAAQLQAEEDARVDEIPPAAPQPPARGIPLAVAMAQIALNDAGDLEDNDEEEAEPVRAQEQRPRGGRRQRNPFPARPPANGAARAVRQHERQARRRQGQAVPPGNDRNDLDDRQQEELQRFLAMAQNDEEEGWDSDELGDDDHAFIIRAQR